MRRILADAQRVRALVAMPAREWATAERALEEALNLARAMPHPYAEAKARYTLALLRRRCDAERAARRELEAARTILTRLGEGSYAERVGRALAAVGAAPGARLAIRRLTPRNGAVRRVGGSPMDSSVAPTDSGTGTDPPERFDELRRMPGLPLGGAAYLIALEVVVALGFSVYVVYVLEIVKIANPIQRRRAQTDPLKKSA